MKRTYLSIPNLHSQAKVNLNTICTLFNPEVLSMYYIVWSREKDC